MSSLHPLVLLLFRQFHSEHHPETINQLFSVFQLRFDVLKMRSLLWSIVGNSGICRTQKTFTIKTMMSDLPFQRVWATKIQQLKFGIIWSTSSNHLKKGGWSCSAISPTTPFIKKSYTGCKPLCDRHRVVHFAPRYTVRSTPTHPWMDCVCFTPSGTSEHKVEIQPTGSPKSSWVTKANSSQL